MARVGMDPARRARGACRELVRVVRRAARGRRANGGRTAISRAVRGAPNRCCGIAAAARGRHVSRSAVAATRRGFPPGPWRNTKRSASDDVGAALGEQCAQHRAVAARLVGAIATHGQVGPVRKRREQIEHAARLRGFHLGRERALERRPRACVVGALCPLEQRLARREVGQPHVVEIALGELPLRHAARRPAHRTDPQSLLRMPRRTEADDADRHDPRGREAPG